MLHRTRSRSQSKSEDQGSRSVPSRSKSPRRKSLGGRPDSPSDTPDSSVRVASLPPFKQLARVKLVPPSEQRLRAAEAPIPLPPALSGGWDDAPTDMYAQFL